MRLLTWPPTASLLSMLTPCCLAGIYYLPFQAGVMLYFRFSGQSIPNRCPGPLLLLHPRRVPVAQQWVRRRKHVRVCYCAPACAWHTLQCPNGCLVALLQVSTLPCLMTFQMVPDSMGGIVCFLPSGS